MKSSKALVVAIVAFIFLGVAAWSWVNFTQSPPYNPEVAHSYIQHFDRRCKAELDDESICVEVIGSHHRRCFEEHLQPTPPERIDEEGPIQYSRPAYMECMRTELEKLLSAP